MAGLLEAMATAGGAIALIDRLAENPKGRERSLDSLRLELVYANADAVSNDWMKRMDGRKRAEKTLAAIKRKIAALRKAGQWDERFTDYYLGKVSRDEVADNPKVRNMQQKYKGKYPTRIREVFVKGGVAYVTTNDGARYAIKASDTNRKIPEVGRDVADYFTNPRGRSKRSINRPSQATGKKPTKRLITRRVKSAKAPKGFFANPVKRGYDVSASGAVLATFKTLSHAKEYGQAFANANNVPVSIRKG